MGMTQVNWHLLLLFLYFYCCCCCCFPPREHWPDTFRCAHTGHTRTGDCRCAQWDVAQPYSSLCWLHCLASALKGRNKKKTNMLYPLKDASTMQENPAVDHHAWISLPWHSCTCSCRVWEHTEDRQAEQTVSGRSAVVPNSNDFNSSTENRELPSSKEGAVISWRKCDASLR